MSAFAQWQPKYAAHGIATFPVTAEKRPATKGYLRTGLRGSGQLAAKFQNADALGFACGPRNKITVLDVDTTDERVPCRCAEPAWIIAAYCSYRLRQVARLLSPQWRAAPDTAGARCAH